MSITVNPINVGAVRMDGSIPNLAWQCPVRDGLAALHFLGHGAEIAKMNFAPGGTALPASFLSPPVVGSGYLELGPSNALELAVGETLAMTLMFTGKRKAASSSVGFIGNYIGTNQIGASLYASSSSALPTANAGRSGGSGGTVTTTGDMDTFTPISVVIPASGAMTIRNHKTGNANASSATGARAVAGAPKMRVGGLYNSTFNAAALANFAAVFSRDLTTDEISRMGVFAAAYMAKCGLS